MRPAPLVLLAALVAAGCATAQRTAAPEPRGGHTHVRDDVTLDGVSLVGAWYAVEAPGDARATRDLEDGTLEMTLLVEPDGRAILTGIDRREGDGAVTFVGQITGNRIRFHAMDGAGTLLLNGRRLILRDPNGKRTAYVRGSGR